MKNVQRRMRDRLEDDLHQQNKENKRKKEQVKGQSLNDVRKRKDYSCS